MENDKIFLIGFIGAPTASVGEKISKELGYDFFILDKLIEEKDGRSIKKIIMMMGEHEYRNKEYEILKEYSQKNSFVMAIGDGALHDDMNMELLKSNPTYFIEEPLDSLWKNILNKKNHHYAFLYDENREIAFDKFKDLYNLRLPLYKEFTKFSFEIFKRF